MDSHSNHLHFQEIFFSTIYIFFTVYVRNIFSAIYDFHNLYNFFIILNILFLKFGLRKCIKTNSTKAGTTLVPLINATSSMKQSHDN